MRTISAKTLWAFPGVISAALTFIPPLTGNRIHLFTSDNPFPFVIVSFILCVTGAVFLRARRETKWQKFGYSFNKIWAVLAAIEIVGVALLVGSI